jgi:GTP-binding protein
VVEARFLASAHALGELPPPLVAEVAFAGRSNVGKSSLLNALTGRRKLVRVSSTPGATRALNFFEVKARDGAQLYLVDLPGYGYAQRSKGERLAWARLLDAYLSTRTVLRAVVLLVDARRGIEEEERHLAAVIAESRAEPPVRLITVATKIDKVPRSRRRATAAALASAGTVSLAVSAESGEGIDDLWRAIRRAAGIGS